MCGKKADHLHHQTYVRVGRERLSDLAALCKSCHEEVHARPGKNLWVDTDRAARRREKQRERESKPPRPPKHPKPKKRERSSGVDNYETRILRHLTQSSRPLSRSRISFLCSIKESEIQRCLKRMRAKKQVSETEDGWIATK